MTAGKLKTAECEDCAVLLFLMAKDNSAAAIHQEIYSAYGQVLWLRATSTSYELKGFTQLG